MTAADIITGLDLQPHPEVGWYTQTWAGDETPRDWNVDLFLAETRPIKPLAPGRRGSTVNPVNQPG